MDSEKGKIDPYDEFFKPRPLWELLKKHHGGKPSFFTEPMRRPLGESDDRQEP